MVDYIEVCVSLHRHTLLNAYIFSLTNIAFHCWQCVSQHDMEPVQLTFSARIVFKNPEILGRVSTHVYILIYYNWCTTTFSVKCFVFH